MIYLPKGFAHGFQTLADNCELFYQISESYKPECTRGVRWNDPKFSIEWPSVDRIMSDRATACFQITRDEKSTCDRCERLHWAVTVCRCFGPRATMCMRSPSGDRLREAFPIFAGTCATCFSRVALGTSWDGCDRTSSSIWPGMRCQKNSGSHQKTLNGVRASLEMFSAFAENGGARLVAAGSWRGIRLECR